MADIVGNILPQIQIAINIGKNIEREIRYYGKSLKFYEMTPSGEVELLSLSEDWVMRPVKDAKDFPEFPFEFEVISDAPGLSDAIKGKTSIVKIDNQKYKIRPPQSEQGNLGIWKFRGQAI